MHFASINNRKGIIEVLLRAGADPSIPNENGLLAGELTGDNEIRSLLSKNTSKNQYGTSSGTASSLDRVRHDLKVHIETNVLDSVSNLNFGKLNIRNDCETAAQPSSSSRKGSISTISPFNNDSTNYENSSHNHDSKYFNSEEQEQEEQDKLLLEELKENVLRAATETAIATQNIEGEKGRRRVANLCQDKWHETKTEIGRAHV